MKKLSAIVISLVLITMSALPAFANKRQRRVNNETVHSTRYYDRYRDGRSDSSVYRNDDYRYRDNRSVWEKHRDKITTAGGAAGGAVLGGLVGGKKGAIIGAITGGAGAAIYTYKIRDKNRRF